MPFKTNGAAKGSLIACMLLLSYGLFAQKTVTGRVLGKVDNQPILGATVVVKGTKVATQTNADGKFTISVPKDNSVLIFSSVGFDALEFPVAGRTDLSDITLAVANSSLNEIVVTGYTTQRKKDITGAVAVVNVKELKSIPGGNPDQLLQGMAAGVQVISSGAPGGASQINIRGITSFGNNTPLYIIDGVQADLHDVNPNDIESIQILKDAGSAAIYGVQGANGVVVVTTRHGHNGKNTISYDGYVSTQRPLGGNPLHLLNSPEMLQVTKNVDQLAGVSNSFYGPNWAIPDFTYNNNGSQGIGNAGDAAVDPSKYAFTNDHAADYLIMKTNKTGTDWFHQIFKPATQQSHNISASGGSDKGSYLISFNYLDQKGTLINNYLKRYSLRVNAQTTVKDHVRVGENLYVFYKKNGLSPNQWETSPVQHIYTAQPVIPVYDIKGNYAGSYDGPGIGNGNNPVADLNRLGTNKYNTWDVVGNIYGEVDLLKHLTLRTSFGGTIDNSFNSNFTYTAYEVLESHSGLNAYTENTAFNNTWLWTNTAIYSNVFAQKHSVKVLIGTEAKSVHGRGTQATGNNLSPDLSVNPNYWTLQNTTANFAVTNPSIINTGVYSQFGRVDYAYDEKYLFAATTRRDGASVLLKTGVRYSTFTSFSAGWRLSNEDFMKGISWINDLKLRGSWGKLGNVNNVGQNNAYDLYGQSQQSSFYDIGGTSNTIQTGYLQTQIGNGPTTWEQDIISNVGVDATLFNHLDVNIEWFNKTANHLLVPYSPPVAGVGFATYPQVNFGKISNKGLDIVLNYHGQVNKDFKFNVGINFTHYKSIVEELPNPGYLDAGASRQGNLVRNIAGQPFGRFYGYKVIGLYRDATDSAKSTPEADAGLGRFKYANTNGDDTITSKDQTTIGNPNPKFTYGINLGASYKSWDFSMFFNGSYGNDIYNYTRYWTDFFGSFGGTKSKNLLYNSWTPTNLNAKTPRAEAAGYFSTNNVANSYYIEKGSFLKCKSMILGYTLPGSILKRVGIDRVRFYGQVVNLFTATKYTGVDPELLSAGSSNSANPALAANASFGIDYGNYPNNQRSFLLGVNLTF